MRTGNPFGRFLDFTRELLVRAPMLSTLSAALFLSTLWTFAWLVVFFGSTWIFDLTTKPRDFVCIFWLSIASESLIRWAENTNFVAALSKPRAANATGDNQDFRLPRAVIIFLLILVAMFVMNEYMEKTGMAESDLFFAGQNGHHSIQAMYDMLAVWWSVATHANVSLPLMIGTLLRAMIYKRSHKPGQQEETI